MLHVLSNYSSSQRSMQRAMIPTQGEDIGEEESKWYGLAGRLWGSPPVTARTYP